jgi:hypothetical protein
MATAKKTETTADIFARRVDLTIEEFKKASDSAKANFVEIAQNNPQWAIVQWAEPVVVCEEAFKVVDHVRKHLDEVGTKYATRREAVLAAVEEFRDDLAESATSCPSSCQFENGIEHARLRGVARGLTALKHLANHEFI